MARKSRQYLQLQKLKNYTPVSPESVPTVNRTALYARLSLCDMNYICRERIQDQVDMVEDFIRRQPDLNLSERYVDNGWTGTNFQRPAFLRMMQDILDGKINCVVTKDLSRLGRNYLETGYYLENLFPQLGVRYISVTDCFDSSTSDSGQLSIILKNILNDFFSRDLSRRFSDCYDLRAEQGVFRNGLPYGYIYDPALRNHLTFDPETSHIVKLIFQWALDGSSIHSITMRLREMNISTPSRVKFIRSDGKNITEGSTRWDFNVVHEILCNRIYTGDFVCGKSYNRKCDPYHRRPSIPEEEWVIIPHSHPAYVTYEEFDRIQKRFANNRKQRNTAIQNNAICYQKQPNYYKHLVFCAICGRSLPMSGAGEIPNMSYHCHSYGTVSRAPHKRTYISKKMLDVLALAQLQNQFRLAAQFKTWIRSNDGHNQILQYLAVLQMTLDEAQARSLKIRENRAELFESHIDAKIGRQAFQENLEQLWQDDHAAKSELEQKATELLDARKALSIYNPWILLFTEIPPPVQLDTDLTHRLIDRIEVTGSNQATIHFKEFAWFERLSSLYRKLEVIK